MTSLDDRKRRYRFSKPWTCACLLSLLSHNNNCWTSFQYLFERTYLQLTRLSVCDDNRGSFTINETFNQNRTFENTRTSLPSVHMSSSAQESNNGDGTRLTSWPSKSSNCRVRKVWYLDNGCFMIYCESVHDIHRHHSLYKYSMVANKWIPFLPELTIKLQHFQLNQIGFDWVKRRIFILIKSPYRDSGTRILHIENQSLLQRYSTGYGRELPQGMLIHVDGKMHCVSDHSHSIWNETHIEWQPISAKLTYPSTTTPGGAYHSQVIHVPSKNILLLFRWAFNSQKTNNLGNTIMHVWRHRIGSNEWTDVLQKEPLQNIKGSVVLSSDEHFVIIAQPHLWILDIRNDDQYKIRKSTVAVPVEHSPRILAHSDCAFGSGNLVSGFTRRLQLDMDIPMVIVKMISEWCSIERIHWITRCGTPNHLMVPLRAILTSEISAKTLWYFCEKLWGFYNGNHLHG